MNKKKQYICFSIIIVLSALLTYVTSAFHFDIEGKGNIDTNKAIIVQKIEGTIDKKDQVLVVYHRDKLLGVLQDEVKINKMLETKYQNEYTKEFPNSKLGLSSELHYSKEYTIHKYENKDQEIIDYIDNKDLYSIEANRITFSNGSVLCVKDEKDYEKAKKEYVLNLVGKDSYEKIGKGEKMALNTEYGRIVKNYGFIEKAKISKGLCEKDKILKGKKAVLNWFLHGYDNSEVKYEVEDGDTVQGVASKNGLALSHLLVLNKNTLQEENQLLEAGTTLNVKKIDSPISLKVEMTAINKVIVYPEAPMYIEDNTLAMGVEVVVQKEENGYQKIIVNEVYKNGELSDNKEISSEIMSIPQRKIVRQGTQTNNELVNGSYGVYSQEGESRGQGNFRWPVDNPSVTCGWECYRNHNAMDIRNRYDRYGPLYASDNGKVITNEYNAVSGYFMEINHGNGFVTYYGHMNEPGFLAVGSVVESGQQIGVLGMTGVATGPHVHFEIRYKGKKMDPAMYLK